VRLVRGELHRGLSEGERPDDLVYSGETITKVKFRIFFAVREELEKVLKLKGRRAVSDVRWCVLLGGSVAVWSWLGVYQETDTMCDST